MMELKQVGEKTYYIENPTNIGIYKVDENGVFIIDSGNDKDAGRKILKITEEQGWTIKGIITTHSNADHIGGNKIIQDRTNCPIYALGIEKSISEFPLLEPSFLYGGFPFKDLRNKFLMAKESKVTEIDNNLPEGLSYFTLRGHFFDMIGIKTDDDIYFLGDSLFSEETITKYHLFFIYDVQEYLNTLEYLSTLDGKYYIPSHCAATKDLSKLIELNKNIINEISEKIYSICSQERTFEEILKIIFDDYQLNMNTNQYVLIGSTIRSYLSYLYDQERLEYQFIENRMLWKQKAA
ncbi:MAG: MBL fold metallo-hydrolase [Bacilli bacterium]|nr:MBL fold metallo-hydrolase [Bacilli bacterium]